MKKQPRITVSSEAMKDAKMAVSILGFTTLSEFASKAVSTAAAPIIRREVTKRGKDQ